MIRPVSVDAGDVGMSLASKAIPATWLGVCDPFVTRHVTASPCRRFRILRDAIEPGMNRLRTNYDKAMITMGTEPRYRFDIPLFRYFIQNGNCTDFESLDEEIEPDIGNVMNGKNPLYVIKKQQKLVDQLHITVKKLR